MCRDDDDRTKEGGLAARYPMLPIIIPPGMKAWESEREWVMNSGCF
jgi:hypothetical protein